MRYRWCVRRVDEGIDSYEFCQPLRHFVPPEGELPDRAREATLGCPLHRGGFGAVRDTKCLHATPFCSPLKGGQVRRFAFVPARNPLLFSCCGTQNSLLAFATDF